MKCLFLLLSVLVIYSCSNSEKKPEKTEYEIKRDKKEELDSLDHDKALLLGKKYSSISDWEEIASPGYTYKLQQVLNDSVISFTGYLSDIVRINDPFKKYGGKQDDPLGILDSYKLKLFSSKEEYIAEVLVGELLFKKMEKALHKKHLQKGCFIFKVKKIESMFPLLSSDGEVDIHGGNEEEGYDYDNST